MMLGNGCKIGLRSTELFESFEISSYFGRASKRNSLFVEQAGKPVLENGARCQINQVYETKQARLMIISAPGNSAKIKPFLAGILDGI